MACTRSGAKGTFLLLCLALASLFVLPHRLNAQEPGKAGDPSPPRWGLIGRYGYYGVPDWLLDMLFEEHPSVDGTIAGAELRYYGESGPEGLFSVGLTLDVGSSEGIGVWQEDKGDAVVVGGGEVDIASAALSLYFDFWPESPLHPYLGLGLGAAWAEGRYERDGEQVTVEEFVPAVHIPVGLLLNLGNHFGIALEARVIDGFSWGGNLQLRF